MHQKISGGHARWGALTVSTESRYIDRLIRGYDDVKEDDYVGKGETILVVDDVEEQRKIASGMLEELGYLAVSVPSGEEA